MRLAHLITIAITLLGMSLIWSRALVRPAPQAHLPVIVQVESSPITVKIEPTPVVVESVAPKIIVEAEPTPTVVQAAPVGIERGTSEPGPESAAWFERARPYCTADRVKDHMRQFPPAAGFMGSAYAAACYTLAGHFSEARRALHPLGAVADHGAQVVYEIVFPTLDPGTSPKDIPTVEFLLEFSPRDLEARYRAGQYRLQIGDYQKAVEHLEIFESNSLMGEFTPSPRELLMAARRGQQAAR